MEIAPAHVIEVAPSDAMTDAMEIAPAHVMERVGIFVQVAVAVPGHKILALAQGVEIIAMELAIVAVGIALVVRVLIQ